ncbi:MAG: RdgB/HAM1 family non-canonical purine NTP pyrophosphatase [Chitinophagaceae bacterium]
MNTLIFATNNPNKVKEIRAVLGDGFDIITLKEAGILIDIPEPHNSLNANASQKSRTIYQLTQKDCFSEDTGLEVTALNGAPGVRSARYAGDDGNAEKNMEKLLFELQKYQDRSARFRTIISLILDGTEYFFEGICEGQIIGSAKGHRGFGYDPIFVPNGSQQSFAEMGMEEKNKFSHRKKATEQLIAFLKSR